MIVLAGWLAGWASVLPAAGPSRQAPGRGAGGSIAAGVSARAGTAGRLLLPGDMPSVPDSAVEQMAQALTTHAVACARLVARYPAQAVDVDDAGVLVYIDTVQDLAALRAVKGGRGGAIWPPAVG